MTVLNYQKVQNNRIQINVEKIKDLVSKHVNYKSLDAIDNSEIEYLRNLVAKKIGLQAFYLVFKEYAEKHGYSEYLRDYARTIISHKTLMRNRIVKDRYRQSYILFLTAEFGLNTKEVEEFALSSLNKKSIYIRNNALRVIQNSGSIPLVLRSLEIVDNSKLFFNYRILVDVLDNFEGKHIELNNALQKNIELYGERIKRAIIEHFSNYLCSDEAIVIKVLEYLRKSNSKEILLICTRYFGSIIDTRAKELILDNLEHQDWEIRGMSAKVLVHYNDDLVREKLIERLSDENYFVRYNSSFSYIEMDHIKNIFANLFTKIKDSYAREILLYAMHSKKLIDYEGYKHILDNLEEGEAMA